LINRHRGIGWEYLHVALADACRLAQTEILPDEQGQRHRCLRRALA
jgi:hypothetical protein